MIMHNNIYIYIILVFSIDIVEWNVWNC